MKKIKWLLLIIILAGGVAWYYLFYKTYSNEGIPQNADIVLSVDVKRNANSIIWYYLTTPSEWNISSAFRKHAKDSVDWKAAIHIPDYIFIFHVKGQPANAFYTVCRIADEAEFQKILIAYDFKESANAEYYSDKLGLDCIKKDSRLLISNSKVEDKSFLHEVASELFDQKKYITEKTLKKIVAPINHFSLYIQQNDFLQEDAIVNGNFKNGELDIDASIQPKQQFSFEEDSFHYNQQSLLNLFFTQPPLPAYQLIPDSARAAASKILNFNIDSLFNSENKKYALDIQSFKDRQDSAITYTYDDDFNKVEKIVVNIVQEPSYKFVVAKKHFSNNLFEYWVQNKNIEQTDKGAVFVSIPFVKTYVTNVEDAISLTSDNYAESVPNSEFRGIFYLDLNTANIPANLLNYLPDGIKKMVSDIERLNVVSTKSGKDITFHLSLTNKQKQKPFLLSFK